MKIKKKVLLVSLFLAAVISFALPEISLKIAKFFGVRNFSYKGSDIANLVWYVKIFSALFLWIVLRSWMLKKTMKRYAKEENRRSRENIFGAYGSYPDRVEEDDYVVSATPKPAFES